MAEELARRLDVFRRMSAQPIWRPRSRPQLCFLQMIQDELNKSQIAADSHVLERLAYAEQFPRQLDNETWQLDAEKFPASQISVCEFLISEGDRIDWGEYAQCAKRLVKEASENYERASHRARECEGLREQLAAIKGALPGLLSGYYLRRQDDELIELITDLRLDADLWKYREDFLISLDSPTGRSRRLEPEGLQEEITKWNYIRNALGYNKFSPLPRSYQTSQHLRHVFRRPLWPQIQTIVPSSCSRDRPLARLFEALGQIQLSIDVAAPKLDNRILKHLEDARRTLGELDDCLWALKLWKFPASHISFCEFLVSQGDGINWEECAKWIESLVKEAKENSERASDQAKVCEELREQLAADKVPLSDFLRSTEDGGPLKNLRKKLRGNGHAHHDLVNELDCALVGIITQQRFIADLWKNKADFLIALNSPIQRELLLKPERLLAEIEEWKYIETAFSTAFSQFPPSDTTFMGADTHNCAIVPMTVTPHLECLLTDVHTTKNILTTCQKMFTPSVTKKPKQAWDETNRLISNAFDDVHNYLGKCGNVAQEYLQLFDYHLNYGPDWCIWQASTHESTSKLLATAERILEVWINLWVRFDRHLSGPVSECFRQLGVSTDHVPGRRLAKKSILENDEIKAMIEGDADRLHPDIIHYDAALRMSRQRAGSMCVFWKEKETRLNRLARGTWKPSAEELESELESWQGMWMGQF